MALFVLHKLILQTRMHSHPVRLDAWFLVRPFVYFHVSCMRTVKALARLRKCAGSPEPSLISTIISWAGINYLFSFNNFAAFNEINGLFKVQYYHISGWVKYLCRYSGGAMLYIGIWWVQKYHSFGSQLFQNDVFLQKQNRCPKSGVKSQNFLRKATYLLDNFSSFTG